MDEQKELEFYYDSLSLEHYPFKILALITVLADEQRAYRGTLQQLCEQLEIQSSSGNVSKIKAALEILVQKQYVHVLVDKTTYTITLTHAAARDKKIIRIKKAWYTLLRERSGSGTWGNALKVFLALLEVPRDTPITYQKIAAQLSISVSTVSRCVSLICSINFTDFKIRKEVVNIKQPDNTFICLGNTFEQMLSFE